MQRPALRAALAVLALVVAFACACVPTHAQDATPTDPFVGTWKLDLDKSVMNRAGGEPIHPKRQATRVISAEGDGYRIATGGNGAGTAGGYFARFDGKEYPDPHGPGKGEVAIHFRLSPNVVVRLVKTNGKPTEWATWAVSSDGDVLTTTSWEPETPEYHNVQVYNREK